MTTTALYRPIGSQELALIEASGWRAFPPPLPEQLICHPVTNEAYAREVAHDWHHQNNPTGLGFVVSFAVRTAFLDGCEHKVADGGHREYRILAADMLAFNAAIEGLIEVIAAYGSRGQHSDALEKYKQ